MLRECLLLKVHAATDEGEQDGASAVSMREFLAHVRDFGTARILYLVFISAAEKSVGYKEAFCFAEHYRHRLCLV